MAPYAGKRRASISMTEEKDYRPAQLSEDEYIAFQCAEQYMQKAIVHQVPNCLFLEYICLK